MRAGLGEARPSASQALLLRAALLKGPEALLAWREWAADHQVEEVDAGSASLLPLVYRNLVEVGGSALLPARLKGIYRHRWSHNQCLFRDLAAILERLGSAGIPVLVLQGGALASVWYADKGTRAIGRLAIAVPGPAARRALELLAEAGWQGGTDPSPGGDYGPLPKSLAHPEQAGIDLHFHLFPACGRREIDNALWAATLPMAPGQQDGGRVLNATDALLMACVQGPGFMGPEHAPRLLWVADAATLIRQAPDGIDWDRLAHLATACRVRPLLLPCLGYLAETLDVAVPEWLFSRLAGVAPGWEERAYGRWQSSRRGARSLGLALLSFSRATLEMGLGERLRLALAKVTGRLQWQAGRPSSLNVPGRLAYRIRRRRPEPDNKANP